MTDEKVIEVWRFIKFINRRRHLETSLMLYDVIINYLGFAYLIKAYLIKEAKHKYWIAINMFYFLCIVYITYFLDIDWLFIKKKKKKKKKKN